MARFVTLKYQIHMQSVSVEYEEFITSEIDLIFINSSWKTENGKRNPCHFGGLTILIWNEYFVHS